MAKAGKKFEQMVKIVERLRRECPWDRVQTFKTLKPFLVEEVHEAIQAINDGDLDHLAEEAGDMLLHVVMLSVMLKEKSGHSISTIIEGIKQKMIRRHPHVFGKHKLKTAEEVLARWEKGKQKEIVEKARKHRGMFKVKAAEM